MKNNSVGSKIDGLGRVVLPANIRQALNWVDGTAVEISVQGENEVVIKNRGNSCVFCGATESLKQYDKKHICGACQKGVARL